MTAFGKSRIFIVAAALIAAPWALGAGAHAATFTVNIESLDFSPANVSISAGDTVRWVWVSGAHSTTSGTCTGATCASDGKWNSGIKSSGSFTHVFDVPGTFPYFCRVHLSAMTGSVIVGGTAPLGVKASGSPACGGPAPLQASFKGSASGGQAPYAFLWDFGDGSADSEQNPIHTYTSAGPYTATLQVTDAAATVASATVPIDARSVPVSVITKVKALTGPFRLAIIGTGFGAHSTILINDLPVPVSKFVSATKVVALKGPALKTMVPLHQDVMVTVRDDDTNVTGCPFVYMRMPAPTGGSGYGGY